VTRNECLKFLVLYDAGENEYSVIAHNLSDAATRRIVNDWQPHLSPGIALIALDQPHTHPTSEAEDCQPCRETVARSANITPKPKFKRRKPL